MGHFSLASGGYFYNFSKAVRFLKQLLKSCFKIIVSPETEVKN
jgi:hypothetical protein